MALLYLEDFVSAIEQLPQDIKQSYTAIRTLDLKVQSKNSLYIGNEAHISQ